MEEPALLAALARLLGEIEHRLAFDSAADVRMLGEQAGRLTGMVARVAERAAARAPAPAITAPLVDAILAARRLRAGHFGAEVGDPAWALLLAAYSARLDGRYCAPGKLYEAAGLHPTTAARWLHRLRESGALTWAEDPEDGRAALVDISDAAAARVEAYLKAALRISPVLV